MTVTELIRLQNHDDHDESLINSFCKIMMTMMNH